MKTCKNYCDEYMKEADKESVKFRKIMKEMQKTMRKKLKTAPKEIKPAVLAEINRITKTLKEIKKHKNDKENRGTCERVFCNPTCKNVLRTKSKKFSFKNTIMDLKNKKHKEEGATSVCETSLK